jgi:hypothetical protein
MEAVYGDGKEKREEEGEENEEEEEGEEDSEGPRDRRFNCCCTADPSQRAMRNCSNCASPTRILYSLYSLSLILPICHSTFFFSFLLLFRSLTGGRTMLIALSRQRVP